MQNKIVGSVVQSHPHVEYSVVIAITKAVDIKNEESGNGIWVSLAKTITEAQNGDTNVKSNIGLGSVFEIGFLKEC